jgi:hypothetical protein
MNKVTFSEFTRNIEALKLLFGKNMLLICATLCHAMPRYATLCHAMPHYAMLHNAMQSYAPLCHAMP